MEFTLNLDSMDHVPLAFSDQDLIARFKVKIELLISLILTSSELCQPVRPNFTICRLRASPCSRFTKKSFIQ